MNEDFDVRLGGFLDLLRGEEARPGASGLARFGRTARGAVALAAGVVRARRSAERGPLGDGDVARIEALVRRLGDLKGVPMKAGQILGYLEADLPEELRRLLALLQTQSQPTPFARVARVVREDLADRAETLLAGLDPTPVSAASIGQVHRGLLPDGTEVAVKVRHPGIEEAIRADFRAATAGTDFAKFVLSRLGAVADWALLEQAYAREAFGRRG